MLYFSCKVILRLAIRLTKPRHFRVARFCSNNSRRNPNSLQVHAEFMCFITGMLLCVYQFRTERGQELVIGRWLCTMLLFFQVRGKKWKEFGLLYAVKLHKRNQKKLGVVWAPFVLVLSHAEKGSTNNEVRYLIQELHISSRWPVLVFNLNNEMNRNMYTEIHLHYSYIILIAGSCKDWEQNTSDFGKQLSVLTGGKIMEPEFNSRYQCFGKLHNFESKNISRSILSHFWTYEISNDVVLILKSNKHAGNDLQRKNWSSTRHVHETAQLVSLWEFRQMQPSW